jgi:hypothetical protein
MTEYLKEQLIREAEASIQQELDAKRKERNRRKAAKKKLKVKK